jgi:hypothetical protein
MQERNLDAIFMLGVPQLDEEDENLQLAFLYYFLLKTLSNYDKENVHKVQNKQSIYYCLGLICHLNHCVVFY